MTMCRSLFYPGEDWGWGPSDQPAWTDKEIASHPLFATASPVPGASLPQHTGPFSTF